MHLKRLLIEHFRNIASLDIACHPRLNIIIGKNGAGKTSLLEAIYFLSHGRSFRSQEMNRLITHQQKAFTLFAEFESFTETLQVGMSRYLSGDAKNRLNSDNIKSTHIITERLPVLLFNPEGFSLLTGGSKLRRQLIDWGTFYHYQEFYLHFKAMRQALKQRNAALKSALSPEEIRLWENAFVTHAKKVHEYRTHYIEALLKTVDELIADFLKQHDIHLNYYQGWARDETLEFCLDKSFSHDRLVGRTHYGPQHADLRIMVGRKLARDILSRGQQKLLICALKLAQGLFLSRHLKQAPIYLFDDLASELDASNRKLILQQIESQSAQVFLTSLSEKVDFLQGSASYFHLENGTT